ncbi:hypothetical protein NECAME_09371 [Necator americanus]|uniref:Uncharacterized protein n=1 Tax=Necator americanus TaxID=51031 RepID=W2TDK3_NECAM|nr:hypothetical protein NECAME_09371 [Necator americanus]ETN80135.1 hypothetical protein NECAME_09371 [Necator americanus]
MTWNPNSEEMTDLPLLLCLLLSMSLSGADDDDCYKFGKTEFTTIVECDRGCEYAYKGNGERSYSFRLNHKIHA